MAVTELGYLILGVSDLAKWRSFAGEVLGLEVVEGSDAKSIALRLDYWHQRIILRETGSDDLETVGWRVAGIVEFCDIQRALRDAGIDFTVASDQEAADRHVLGLLKCFDPGGHPIEIFYGPRIETAVPFHPGRRMHGPFVTGSSGLGHIVLNQGEPAKAEAFYRDVFGMRGSLELRREGPTALDLYFMSSNDRQHSLAFGKFPGSRRISHFMTEHSRLEDVGLTRDLAVEHGVPFRMEIGQHHNDWALSFYLQTPSGWAWEIGWGVGKPSGQAEYAKLEIWGHEMRHTSPPVSAVRAVS